MKPIHRAALLAVLAVAAACARPNLAPAPATRDVGPMLTTMLNQTTAAWDRGDLEGFIVTYADTATVAASNGVTRGKAAIREQYRRSYFQGGVPAATLRFSEIEVRPLGSDHALMVGRFILTPRAAGTAPTTGFFSLTWARTPDGWRIIHDHSS
ncbi:MAG TPA: nuclear transport factor 2 family protein [Longimicrobium sp.]|nr:nuclear transport factor 2 family protein [Longimicrobium sp.]